MKASAQEMPDGLMSCQTSQRSHNDNTVSITWVFRVLLSPCQIHTSTICHCDKKG